MKIGNGTGIFNGIPFQFNNLINNNKVLNQRRAWKMCISEKKVVRNRLRREASFWVVSIFPLWRIFVASE